MVAIIAEKRQPGAVDELPISHAVGAAAAGPAIPAGIRPFALALALATERGEMQHPTSATSAAAVTDALSMRTSRPWPTAGYSRASAAATASSS